MISISDPLPSTVSIAVSGDRRPGLRATAAQLICGAMEASVLVLVCLAPWMVGKAAPVFDFILYAELAALLALWGARMLLEGRLSWTKCPVALCLAGLFLSGVWQLTPLPHDLLARQSPATARMYERLLPSPSDIRLPEGKGAALVPPGSTISLYPQATRRQVIQLLALLMLFVMVRNNISSAGGLRRLSMVVLVNGALLALFGLLQFAAAARWLSWIDRPDAQAFGTFASRGQFAFYLDLGLGLGLGLLLGRSFPVDERSARPDHPVAAGWRACLPTLMLLGVSAALLIMLGSLAFCLSWDGLVALLGASLLCSLLQLWRPGRLLRQAALFLALGTVLVLAVWLGRGVIDTHLGTFWKGDVFREDHLPLWSRSWHLVRDFPLWGTGFGTFSHIEPLTRSTPVDARFDYDHAHNEYLEALIEGGVVRLLLSVLAIVLVYRLGYRAWRQHQGRPEAALALGALFGFTTLVIHSGFDFGLHIPAIALLAAVLAALLTGLGRESLSSESPSLPLEKGRRLAQSFPGSFIRGLAPLAGAALAVVLGLVLLTEGWRDYGLKRFQALAAGECVATEAARERSIEYLEAAARLAPGDAPLQLELGQAHLALFAEKRERLALDDRLTAATQATSALTPTGCCASAVYPGWAGAPLWLFAAAARQRLVSETHEQLSQKHLGPALHHLVQAREACPLWAEPHMHLAADLGLVDRAEDPSVSLERAQWVAPADPGLWYRCGIQELEAGHPEQVWKSWRRSLELSDLYLADILDHAVEHLEAGQILPLLPEQPRLLLSAAAHLYPHSDETAQRRPFWEKALEQVEKQPAPLTPEDRRLEGKIHQLLGHALEARAAYEAALAQQPRQARWRFELAELLHEQGHDEEARRELLTVLNQQPDDNHARSLLHTLEGNSAHQ